MMKAIILLLLISLAVCMISNSAAKKGNSRGGSAAIPSRKLKHHSIVGRFGQGSVGRILRELKTSFCSDLEAVSLQVTKPNSDAVSLSLIDDLTSFVALGHQDQADLTNLVVKLSRKFGEANAYGMLKAMFVLHTLHDTGADIPRNSLAKALLTLRSEKDGKTSKLHFDEEYTRLAAGASSTADELTTVDLVRSYSQYVMDYFALRSETGCTRSSTRSQSSPASLIAKLRRLQTAGRKVLSSLQNSTSALNEQCATAVRKTQTWIDEELLRLGLIARAKQTEGGNRKRKDGNKCSEKSNAGQPHHQATRS